MPATLTIPSPKNFNFWSTVYSHGWCALPPFHVDREKRTFTRILTDRRGKPVVALVHPRKNGDLDVSVDAGTVAAATASVIVRDLRACFRMDESYDHFYSESARHPEFRWVKRIGAGRMLRSPSVFEDVVKMICTTNCSWALTEVMVSNLCRRFGIQVAENRFSFPTPEAIADGTERFLRKEIRSGYRSPYLLELSRAVARREIDLEDWRRADVPDEEMFERVLSVKGVGPYAAGNILKLLGRYDYLGIDSWTRSKFSDLHAKGRKRPDKAIERHYERFGKWKGLFFWLDVTRDWYRKEFPF